MKRFFLLTLLPVLFSSVIVAQQVNRCATHDVFEINSQKHADYAQGVHNTFDYLKQVAAANNSNQRATGDTIYRIPVIVHIVHEIANPEENIHDSLVYNQIQVLNEDYNRTNADAIDTRAMFDTIAGNGQIEFYLAHTDPNGNFTTGINRVSTTEADFALDIFAGGTLDKIKFDSLGGVNSWPTDQYLNIWVGDLESSGLSLGQVLGFAYPPTCAPNWPQGQLPTDPRVNGVVIHYKVFGRNNPLASGTFAIADKGRTPTHEVGHYLGLRHIWGDANVFLGEDGCLVDDGIDDTPNCADNAAQVCNFNKNTCTDPSNDMPDMIENFMDYAEERCMNMFTKGQIDIMRASLATCRGSLPIKMVEGEDNSAWDQTLDLDTDGDSISVVPGDTINLSDGSQVIAGNAGGVIYNSGGTIYVSTNGTVSTVSDTTTEVTVAANGTVGQGEAPQDTIIDAINTPELDKYLSIFPNPTANNINITFNQIDRSIERISMVNTLGQTVLEQVTRQADNRISLDVANQPQGVYVLYVQIDGQQLTRKVIIQ